MPVPEAPPRIRDAERSREAILQAAERQFAGHGFDGVSLQEIATEAGLSRGAPSYFFGSKDLLYEAVLERVFRKRDEATRRAFAPVFSWIEGDGGRDALEQALERAISGYLEFLIAFPAFVRLLDWEAIGSAGRIHSGRGAKGGPTRARGQAMAEAFAALRKVHKVRGLAAFDVEDVVLLTVALTFSAVSQRATLMSAFDRDLGDRAAARHHTRLVVGQLLHMIAPA